ncbi:COMM domain-containing protein 10 isoform X1 [Rhinoderma darwinii]|uniref:COMM domain-containing protein 10 isoform X1 n=1 Tax=Rhinoderma darwinii TaxID=43563 RepID=UPI003F674FA2
MATAIFKDTVSIKQAVSIINDMDAGKFPRLLSRILQKLHLKTEQSFNEEEEEKLQAAFSLDKQSLKLVLETISFILEQAVYHNLKTPVFRQQLENIRLEQSKTEAFAIVWENAGQETVEKFRQRTLTPKKLETTAWQLNLQMAQSTQAKMKSPQAVLELGVSTEDTKVPHHLVPWTNRAIGTVNSTTETKFVQESANHCSFWRRSPFRVQ